jgi:hypothetical protein
LAVERNLNRCFQHSFSVQESSGDGIRNKGKRGFATVEWDVGSGGEVELEGRIVTIFWGEGLVGKKVDERAVEAV